MGLKPVVCILTILSLGFIPASLLVNPSVGVDPVDQSAGLYVVSYNPYSGIDWNTAFRLKTQLHAHTILGGGGSQPYMVINSYAANEFGALGISDYNQLTWPWTLWEEFLTPGALNMVPIQNDEVASSTAHFTAPFLTSAVNGSTYGSNVQGTINAIAAAGGIPILSTPVAMGFSLTRADSWTGFQGIEIYNAVEGPQLFNFQLWDHLLTDPARAQKHIWGVAVDDSHDSETNEAWIVVYAAQKTAASVKSSFMAGSFVAAVNSQDFVNSIIQVSTTLVVDTSSSVVWKADGGQIVGTGSTLDLATLAGGYTYVRAEVNDGAIFTQPIFITQTTPYAIFSNGFEDGLASWDNTVGSGYFSESSDTAHSGSYSAKVGLIHYYGDKAYANKSLGAGYKRIDIKAYVNFSTISTTGIVMVPLSLSSSDNYRAAVVRNFESNQWGIRVFSPHDGSATLHWERGTSGVAANVWYSIELEAVISTRGFSTLWVDGDMKLNVTNINFVSSTITSAGVGVYTTLGDLSTYLRFYVDDVVVTVSGIGSINHDPIGPIGYDLIVAVSGNGITNATGSQAYGEFTNVTVMATPVSGSFFDHWLLDGTNVGSQNPYTLNMTADYELTAVFTPIGNDLSSARARVGVYVLVVGVLLVALALVRVRVRPRVRKT